MNGHDGTERKYECQGESCFILRDAGAGTLLVVHEIVPTQTGVWVAACLLTCSSAHHRIKRWFSPMCARFNRGSSELGCSTTPSGFSTYILSLQDDEIHEHRFEQEPAGEGHQGCGGSIKSGVVGQKLQSSIGRSDIWGRPTPQTQLGSCIYHIDVNRILLKRMITVRTDCGSERERS